MDSPGTRCLLQGLDSELKIDDSNFSICEKLLLNSARVLLQNKKNCDLWGNHQKNRWKYEQGSKDNWWRFAGMHGYYYFPSRDCVSTTIYYDDSMCSRLLGDLWYNIKPKSRYYKEKQVDRKKRKAIRWWFVSIRHGRHVLSQCPKQRHSPPGNIKKWLLIPGEMPLFRALAKNIAPMTNADESPTNRLTLFWLNISLFIVSTLWLNCDRVRVLDQGEIKEYDCPAVLLNKPGGLFKKLE